MRSASNRLRSFEFSRKHRDGRKLVPCLGHSLLSASPRDLVVGPRGDILSSWGWAGRRRLASQRMPPDALVPRWRSLRRLALGRPRVRAKKKKEKVPSGLDRCSRARFDSFSLLFFPSPSFDVRRACDGRQASLRAFLSGPLVVTPSIVLTDFSVYQVSPVKVSRFVCFREALCYCLLEPSAYSPRLGYLK